MAAPSGIPQDIGPIVIQSSGANSSNSVSFGNNNAPSVPVGSYITKVSCHLQNAGGTGVPAHGELYVSVTLARISQAPSGVTSRRIAVLWGGYLDDFLAAPPSIPNIFCGGSGFIIQASVFWGSNRTASDVLEINVEVSQNPAPGSFIFFEPPYSGVGFKRIIQLGDPAAGANLANQAVPSFVRWKIQSLFIPVTAFTAANKGPFRVVADGNEYIGGSGFTTATAAAGFILFIKGVGQPTGVAGVNGANIMYGILVDVWLRTAQSIAFILDQIVAGDNIGASQMTIEEWAGPQE